MVPKTPRLNEEEREVHLLVTEEVANSEIGFQDNSVFNVAEPNDDQEFETVRLEITRQGINLIIAF